MFLAFTKFHHSFFFCLGPFLYLISWTRAGWENCPVSGAPICFAASRATPERKGKAFGDSCRGDDQKEGKCRGFISVWNFDTSKYTIYSAIIQTKVPPSGNSLRSVHFISFRGREQDGRTMPCLSWQQNWRKRPIYGRERYEAAHSSFSRPEERRPTPFAKLAHNGPVLA